MPRKREQYWTESLFDSVYALYETATEYRTALGAAQLAVSSVDYDRRRTHEGRIGIEGRTTVHGRPFTTAPHDRALHLLSRTYRDTETKMRGHFEDSALLYASGTAWAIRTVLEGGTPPVVAFQVDEDRSPVPRGMTIPPLDRYAGATALTAAYEEVVRRAGASEYAEDLAGRDYVSEHEAGEMHAAIDVAEGLAGAAFAYGLLAQRALSFVLLEPRRARERELAAAWADSTPSEPSA
ncbi:hypothetical protein [uncultured Streptomyces sp.]|uniref:hypothetical protein n=1 Tax=uncultured Streptomyces sp. TaxID=174707 RepID=UPI002632EA12|nr:hypothetical protein [uncultured Streptomyces sp.]